jgi:hypothetical protein
MVEASKFIPQDSFIFKNIKKAIENQKQEQSTIPSLTPDDAVVQPFESYFQCTICLNVLAPSGSEAMPVSMCEECEKLNCKGCIDKWHKKSQDCPNCRAKYRAATKISRFTLNSLQGLQF